MRIIIMAVAALAMLAAKPAGPDVAERNGTIIYHDQQGTAHVLTSGGKFVQPELSPDGKSVAFIKVEIEGDPGTDQARTSLWVADIASGKARRLLASTPAEGMTETLAAMWKPQYSLDGGFVYVMAEAWTTSSAIHQINVKTGTHHFVTDGELLFVLRTGRYRGFLMVMKHVYRGGDEPTAYNAAFVIRPDGKASFMIPGSDKDEGDKSIPRWLRKNASPLK